LNGSDYFEQIPGLPNRHLLSNDLGDDAFSKPLLKTFAKPLRPTFELCSCQRNMTIWQMSAKIVVLAFIWQLLAAVLV
jgi:hypothetical protein